MTLKAPPANNQLSEVLAYWNGMLSPLSYVEAFTSGHVIALPTIPEARRLAAENFRTIVPLYLVHYIVRASDSRVMLVSFGPKGAYRVRWNFGRYGDPLEMIHLRTTVTNTGTACGRRGPAVRFPADARITCPACLLDLAAARETTPDKLYDAE